MLARGAFCSLSFCLRNGGGGVRTGVAFVLFCVREHFISFLFSSNNVSSRSLRVKGEQKKAHKQNERRKSGGRGWGQNAGHDVKFTWRGP